MSIDDQEGAAGALTPGGSRVYRHGEPTPWSPPRGEAYIDEISAHLERHLGPVQKVLHEIVSDTVHIDLHIIPPSAADPYTRLVSSGMSDLPMATPEDIEAPRYAELMITLPPDWKLDEAALQDEAWYWPCRLLTQLARLPHKYQTWLGVGHTVPNGDPAQPYAENTAFCGALILPPVSTTDGFGTLEIPGVKTISFYSVLPLYLKEMELKLRRGTDELLERFDRKGITDIVVPGRADVTARKFRFW